MEELSTQQSEESESPATENSSSQVRVGRGNSSFPLVNGARALGWGNVVRGARARPRPRWLVGFGRGVR
eukprot:11221241-Alexandrium_andersonii.AAC.1